VCRWRSDLLTLSTLREQLATMLARSLKQPQSVALLLFLFVVLVWQLQRDMGSTPLPPVPDNVEVAQEPVKEKGEPRIALVTFITDQKSYIHISLKNKDHYARRHGLDFVVDYESHSPRGVLWTKFDMIERLIKQNTYDWIWWMDFDTLITNTNIKITDIVAESLAAVDKPDDIDYLLSHDCNGLNAGSFLVRGHNRSISFLDKARARHDAEDVAGNQFSEQDSMVVVLREDDAYNNYAYQVPQFKLNAFPEEIKCYDQEKRMWEPGAFVIHFAGAWAYLKDEDPTGVLMEKYRTQIIWGDWESFSP
jgi:mannan polymerase II complex MNN10 subunit